MSQTIDGGLIKEIIYECGMLFIIVEGKHTTKVHLNQVIPDEYRDGLVGRVILFMEGEFSLKNKDSFFPSRIVLKGKSQLDFQL